ncbi:hypothetical protein QBC47DRAFT_362959 [Echria macrotheca]|uniref:CFEM domain-containing protein n=1 Tax=Echria macrotheca TaxID=438768 RepID=A0AAJ0B8E8_9PEZI|nr:hypothetical protein QBC47DRAFT_362959 [Echria macrotheca]
MHLLHILSAILAGASVAHGQADCPATTNMPSCAVSCLMSAASAIGCTNMADYNCQCSGSAALRSRAEGCVLSTCGPVTALQASSAGAQICSSCQTTPAPTPV